MFMPRVSTAAVLFAGLALSSLTSAQTRTWDFTDTTAPGACATAGGNGSGIGNNRNCQEGSSNAAAAAVNATSLNITALSAANVSSGLGNGTFSAGAVINHGATYGLGVGNSVEGGTAANQGNSDHSMDSANGNGVDGLLLSFTSAQVLRTVTLGWSGSDGDFQVLRYMGTGTIDPTGRTAATMVGAGGGWQLVSTVSAPGGIGTPDQTFNINGLGLSSSYWLITAFNSNFGGSTGDTTADALKVMGVTSRPNGVPEPGSLTLAGFALLGLVASRRKAKA